jgi:23S rRNA pseudouridine2605 synthase
MNRPATSRPKVLPRNGTVPLERALSKLGLASRGETKAWVLAGRLTVNGEVIQDPLWAVNPEQSVFALDGHDLQAPEFCLLAFHKPRGCVTTRSDPDGKSTIYDHLPVQYRNLHAVGRLDQNTSGLLLLTNDTRLSDYLTDPHNAVARAYVVEVRGLWAEKATKQALAGVSDQGEELSVQAVEVLKSSGRESRLLLTLCEGKNREIRRLCKILGHEVLKLKRVRYGRVELGDLAVGQCLVLEREAVYP